MTKTGVPLVSIIVRSMDRPMLDEALGAIASQTYPAIEALVVDATGGSHAPVAPRCGPFPLIFVSGSTPRTRPVAANAGLDAAHGAYIGLLDDDDLIAPSHIEGLVAALEAKPECAVAYSLAREIDAGGVTIRRRGASYSRLRLFQDCYILSGAALFRSTVRETCRFDERFDVCEDWDFWLQASRLSDFLQVPQDTAVYRSQVGQSGMAAVGTNQDVGKLLRYRELIAAKWRDEGQRLAAAEMPGLDAEFERAQSDFARGDRATAEMRAGAILRHSMHHVGALTLLGTIEALRGDFKAALGHFAHAAEVEPGDPAMHFNLAQAHERLGMLDAARASYAQVLKLSPEHRHARARLAAIESATTVTPSPSRP